MSQAFYVSLLECYHLTPGLIYSKSYREPYIGDYVSDYYSHSHPFYFHKHCKVSSIQNFMENRILTTRYIVVIFIFIFFPFYKHSRLGDIFLLGNQSLFLSQIAVFNLYTSIKPLINKRNQYPFSNLT